MNVYRWIDGDRKCEQVNTDLRLTERMNLNKDEARKCELKRFFLQTIDNHHIK